MATGRGSSTARAAPAPGVQNNAPRRPSLALQPFAWGGLQILPVAPTAAELVAVVPPPLPGLHRTAPFRVSEYDEHCRIAVMALEAALGPGELADAEVASPRATGGLDLDLDEDPRTLLDLSDLAVPLPPGISRAFGSSIRNSPGCETEHVPPNLRPSGSPYGRIAAATRAEGTAMAAEPGCPAGLTPAAGETRTPPLLPPPESAGEVAAASMEKLEEKTGGFKQECSSGGSPSDSNLLAAVVAMSGGEHQGAGSPAGATCQDGAGPQGQDVPGRGRVPGTGPGCKGDLSHQDGGAVEAHEPAASPSEVSNLKETGTAQQPAHSHRRPVGSKHQTQEPQNLFQQPSEDHQPEPQDGGERPAKRRRAVPAWLRKDYQLLPLQLSPREVAAAATAAGAGEGKTGDQQPLHEPRIQRAERGTGKCVSAKGHPEQPLGNGAAAVKDDVQTAGPSSYPSGGGGGSNGGGTGEVGIGEQQQQQGQEEEKEKEKQALAWWDSLLSAAPQLESLKRALQAVPRQPQPRGGANGKRQEEDQMQNAGESLKDGIVDEEERELQEEVERGERARQRWLAGEDDNLHVGDGPSRPRQRQHGTVAGTDDAVTLTCGAYGPASKAAGSSLWQQRLPAAAAAALERIHLAVNGPPQLAPLTVRLPGGWHGPEGPARDQLQGGAEPADPSLKDEVVLWVVVCGPGQPQVLHEEYLVLGSQRLSDLRDVLGCATEDAMRQAAQVAQVPMSATAEGGDKDGCRGAAGKGLARSRARSNGGGDRRLEAAAAGEAATGRPGGRGGPNSRRPARGRGRAESRLPPLDSAVCAGHSGDGAVTAAAAATVAGGDGNQNAGNPAALAGSPPLPLGSSVELLPPSYGSYLFVEGHFYTDVRHPDAEDYTAPIRELCSAHGVRPTYLRPERGWRPALVRHDGDTLPPPKAMHTTRFSELTLRQANHPTGIFCHRACCEHLMFVRDVRRWHLGDPADRSAFPVRLRTRDRAGAPVARRRCSVCEARYAELVTHDDPLAPSNPAVMCRHCFDLLHVGSNGERLVPNVIAQPYNPALDIATQGIWAPSAGAWAALNAAGDTSGGGGGGHNDNIAGI
ncbi:hypothetical protein Vafri_21872 [Volvox africanus]|uniref:snRNA transcription factor n=1 Tax=Volvox africanus TaxID=51714 RepID=A0A8J4BU95_9CHLO|nr:hypothetical protein Vafri_21872 [Volvox africanus]